ncbi:MAG: hypothetical protein M1127_00690 [Patescibacteria group bacterium]|nr:hypothetical protein [Patescibacteria group bacterium]
MQNYAVIDIGTLKVKFLVAQVLDNGGIKEVYFSNNLTCFGCNMDETGGHIAPNNLQTTIGELLRCKKLLCDYSVVKFKVVSTHALRNAKNREAVKKEMEEKTGFEIENISQDQEALLFFKAVMNGFPDNKKEYTVVDVGGGSVQILIGNKKELKLTHRMRSGAQFLHENFTQNPHLEESFTTEQDIENMRRYLLEQLIPLPGGLKTPIIYGSTCIIDFMKAIGVPLDGYSESKTHPFKTYAKVLDDFIKKVLPLRYREREERFPFQQGYTWGMDKAFLNITTLAEKIESPFIIPSNANVSQGILYDLLD